MKFRIIKGNKVIFSSVIWDNNKIILSVLSFLLMCYLISYFWSVHCHIEFFTHNFMCILFDQLNIEFFVFCISIVWSHNKHCEEDYKKSGYKKDKFVVFDLLSTTSTNIFQHCLINFVRELSYILFLVISFS